ncbi:hypothetical protein [Rhizobium sp. YTU87027]|uniref:hypothetical protein n=1 Tax=Rhizobium sp. YTU87027 TaxID=3417741 RepID=UPI003D69C4B2
MTAANDVAVFVSEGSGNWRCAAYTRASGAPIRADTGHFNGLTLSNDAGDLTNDIGIAIGAAASENDISPILMALTSALIKRLDANWSAGTNNGMRYSGAAIANTTYHIYLCSTAGGGNVDIYADPSADLSTVLTHLQAETGGSAYTKLRRIGSIVRISAAIQLFKQVGTVFIINNVTEQTASSTSAKALRTLTSVPSGISVRARLAISLQLGSSASVNHSIYTPLKDTSWAADLAASAASTSAGFNIGNWYGAIETNTSGQIYSAVTISGACVSALVSNGWDDYTLRG